MSIFGKENKKSKISYELRENEEDGKYLHIVSMHSCFSSMQLKTDEERKLLIEILNSVKVQNHLSKKD